MNNTQSYLSPTSRASLLPPSSCSLRIRPSRSRSRRSRRGGRTQPLCRRARSHGGRRRPRQAGRTRRRRPRRRHGPAAAAATRARRRGGHQPVGAAPVDAATPHGRPQPCLSGRPWPCTPSCSPSRRRPRRHAWAPATGGPCPRCRVALLCGRGRPRRAHPPHQGRLRPPHAVAGRVHAATGHTPPARRHRHGVAAPQPRPVRHAAVRRQRGQLERRGRQRQVQAVVHAAAASHHTAQPAPVGRARGEGAETVCERVSGCVTGCRGGRCSKCAIRLDSPPNTTTGQQPHGGAARSSLLRNPAALPRQAPPLLLRPHRTGANSFIPTPPHTHTHF